MENNYLVSLITPFHNTRMDMFTRGFESLKNQTLGFEKIEWIVAVHNSDEYYKNAVLELTKGYDNIKILILDNEHRTPSSPRNHALDHATGKYIAFMDSDDYLTVDGLEEVVNKMEETGADISSFRAETEAEDDTVIQAIDTRARFDQTESCIELDKGDPRINDLIYAGGLTIWCKLIRRDYMEERHIRFSLDITYGEDVCFSMECLKDAKKVLILPQTIVYVYFMNHGSLAQKTDHTPESLMSLAKDFAKIFEVTMEGKFALENLAWPVMGYLAEMMAITPGLDEEYKESMKALMSKYFDVMGPLKPDAKFFNEQIAQYFMQRAKMIILGEIPENADMLENYLLPILQNNATTEYGTKFGFADIKTVEDYQKKVPVTDYTTYQPFIKLMTRIGETNIICADKVIGYSLKKASDGTEYKVPQTASIIQRYQDILTEQLSSTSESTFVLMEGMPKDKNTHFKDDTYLNSIRGTVFDRLRAMNIYNSHSYEYKYGMMTAPEDLIFLTEKMDTRYARLLFALADADVSQIVSPFSINLLDTMRFLECMWKVMVKDIAEGTVSEESLLSDNMRKLLETKLKAQPERAKQLQEIFEEGFENVIPKIWPKMEKIYAAGSGEFSVYTRQLKKYTGEVPVDYGYLDCAEAVIGKSVGPNQNKYVLLQNESFFEFLPEDGSDDEIVTSKMLKEGVHYEVVITNQCGLYRYRSGIVVETASVNEDQVLIRYCYKKSSVLHLEGVRLDTLQIRQAGKKIDERTNAVTYDYCVVADEKEKQFVLFMEPECDTDYDMDNLTAIADEELKNSCASYAKGRDEGVINPVKVHILQSASSELRDQVIPDQSKPIHSMANSNNMDALLAKCVK